MTRRNASALQSLQSMDSVESFKLPLCYSHLAHSSSQFTNPATPDVKFARHGLDHLELTRQSTPWVLLGSPKPVDWTLLIILQTLSQRILLVLRISILVHTKVAFQNICTHTRWRLPFPWLLPKIFEKPAHRLGRPLKATFNIFQRPPCQGLASEGTLGGPCSAEWSAKCRPPTPSAQQKPQHPNRWSSRAFELSQTCPSSRS